MTDWLHLKNAIFSDLTWVGGMDEYQKSKFKQKCMISFFGGSVCRLMQLWKGENVNRAGIINIDFTFNTNRILFFF